MPGKQFTVRATRGIQLPLFAPTRPPRPALSNEAKGVVYTKRWVVELLLDHAGYRSNANLVDAVAVEPAAGDGAFLLPMVERLVQSCRRLNRPLSECAGSLIAYELDDDSADRARALTISILSDCAVEIELAEHLAASWVRTGDYLLESTCVEADFVIGNPPYVRLEDIPEETAALYRTTYRTMRGRADLYVAFFEAALQQLNQGGVCAFICADRWMRNQYGAELRELVTSSYSVEVVIEMHDAHAFDDEVDAYPAISVIRRQGQGLAVVASAGSLRLERSLKHLKRLGGTKTSTYLKVFARRLCGGGSKAQTHGHVIHRNNWRSCAASKSVSLRSNQARR